MTPLETERLLGAVKTANECILRQLRNLAHNPHNANARMALADAIRSHGKAVNEVWQPSFDLNISATRKRPPQGDISP